MSRYNKEIKGKKLVKHIEQQAITLSAHILRFSAENRLGKSLFELPESLQIKSQTTADFAHIVEGYAAKAEEMSILEEANGGFLALARLAGKIALPGFDSVEWVEIIERKNRDPKLPRLSAINFFQDDMEKVHTILRNRSVRSTNTESEAIISLPTSQDIRFIDTGSGVWLDTERKVRKAVDVKLTHD